MSSGKIADKTVLKNLGFCGFAINSNTSCVDVKDGRIVRIRPLHLDEAYTKEELNYYYLKKGEHVFEPGFKTLIPPFSIAYKNRAYSGNRVPSPLIRVDWDPKGERNPQNRGISKYRKISWDEALEIISDEIKRIHDEYGNHSIYCQAEGHGEGKVAAGAHGCPQEMLAHCGGSTIQARQPDSWEGWYWGAKHMWGMEPLGQCTAANGTFRDITQNGDAVLFWGCDPETTTWGWNGQQPSRMCFWFNEIGVKSIYICPDVNYGAACHADKWIPVLPNTDAAMQLAIAYVWITEDTYDKDYIATHAVGFDWFEKYVLGELDGEPKTPKWAEAKCGVPSWEIKAFARYWAKHNVSTAHSNGGGYIRGAFAHEPARLEVALLGMQGFGGPGKHQIKFIEWTMLGMLSMSPLPEPVFVPANEAAYHGWDLAGEEPNRHIIKTLIPQAILNPPISWYGHGICTYPREDQFNHYQFPREGEERLHMIWADSPCWSTCWNGGNIYEEALRHESIEFVLVQHPWMENDTVFADIILPVKTVFECSDIATDSLGGQFPLYYVEEVAIDPVGEARSDAEIVADIAGALERFGGKYEGLRNKFMKGMTHEETIRKGFDESGLPEDFTWEDLMEKKFWAGPVNPDWENTPAGLIAFHDDPEIYKLQTPTGKIEYYSATLAEKFPDDDERGPFPKWIEESEEHKERISSDRAKDYPFLLVTNHPRWRVHAQMDDIPWFREIETCKVEGPDGYLYEPIWVNPIDAEKLGLANGDIARLFNERGSVLGGIRVTERIMPGALYQDHGARIDSIVAGTGGLDRGGANNLICPNATTSKNAGGEVTNSFLVGIEKVDVMALAQQYPEQFSRTYDNVNGLLAVAYIED